MLHIPFILMEAEFMSSTTHFVHLFVTDISNLFMYIMELLSALLIVVTTVIAFIKLFQHKPYARVYLLHGQSVGLSFKLGAEILKTITAQNIMDIWEIILLIIIKAAMMLLIEVELKGVDDPYAEVGFKTTRKEQDEIKKSIFYHPNHAAPANHETSQEELEHIREDLDKLLTEVDKITSPTETGKPIL